MVADDYAITAVYESVIHNEFRWLLLHYPNANYEELALFAHGFGDIEELKSKIYDYENVFIGFYREEMDNTSAYVIINYVPSSIAGVKKARAQTHLRRIGTMFKERQITVTVDDLSQLTTTTILNALADQKTTSPPLTPLTPMGRSFSQPADKANTHLPRPIVYESVRRSFSETYAPDTYPSPTQHVAPSKSAAGMLSTFLRRKKRIDDSDDMPPPTPPKDVSTLGVLQPQRYYMSAQTLVGDNAHSQFMYERSRMANLSDFAVISHIHSDEGLIDSPSHRPMLPSKNPDPPMYLSLPLKGKWAPESSLRMDPAERARRRREEQKKRQEEERDLLRQDEERQMEIKRQKEELRRQEEEEEEQRRISIEEELRWATAEKRRNEELERIEEEQKKREIEERKQRDRERRLREHQKLERWRKEQAALTAAAAREAEEARLQEEAERKKKIKLVETIVKCNSKVETLFTGWVTVQVHDSVVWKRRFYKVEGDRIYLYRSLKETDVVLDDVMLSGKVKGLREWKDGYEHLEAIPHSFVIEFADERQAWLMYADSEEEKFKILGLIHHAARL